MATTTMMRGGSRSMTDALVLLLLVFSLWCVCVCVCVCVFVIGSRKGSKKETDNKAIDIQKTDGDGTMMIN